MRRSPGVTSHLRWSFNPVVRLALLAATPLAQAAAQARTLPPFPRAVPPAAVAESLRVLAALEQQVQRNRTIAAVQHRLGNVALALELTARSAASPRVLDRRRLRRTAEQAYQAALDLEPDTTLHWLALGRFYTTGDGNAERLPRIYYDRGIVLAREQRDTAMIATMGLELGTLHWRHANNQWRAGAQVSSDIVVPSFGDLTMPDSLRDRDLATGGARSIEIDDPLPGSVGIKLRSAAPFSVHGAAGSDTLHGVASLLSSAGRNIRETIHPFPGINAESFYLNAEAYVSEAYAIRPTDSAVFHRLAAVFLLEDRWGELRGIAEARAHAAPTDPWALLALGLAQQRQGESRLARKALDSALALLSTTERARLDRIDRVLSPRDSVAFARSDSATRAHTTAVFWQLADPLWSNDEGDPRTEFLARLAYAELRFTWHDGSHRGADTPQGALYVRYGPPDDVRGSFWMYRNGLILSSCMRHGRAVMFQSPMRDPDNIVCGEDERLLGDILAWQPARWDNATRETIDSIPAQIARFRASADSVDIYLAGRLPFARLRDAQVTNGTVRADLWLYAWDSPEARRREVEPVTDGSIEFRERVLRGRYYYRMESSAPGTLSAARATGTIAGVADSLAGFASSSGFGMSDVLIAARVEAPSVVRRWHELAIAPQLGAVERESGVALVWEAYDLARRNGDAEYSVTITIQRARASARPIAARIIGSIANAVGVRSNAHTLTMQFDRRVPHADVVVENVQLSLGDTPPDTYSVTISLRDHVTGSSVQRTFPLTVVQRGSR